MNMPSHRSFDTDHHLIVGRLPLSKVKPVGELRHARSKIFSQGIRASVVVAPLIAVGWAFGATGLLITLGAGLALFGLAAALCIHAQNITWF